jgi:hypothetical protein
LIITGDIQKRLLLPRKRGLRQILCRRRGPHCDNLRAQLVVRLHYLSRDAWRDLMICEQSLDSRRGVGRCIGPRLLEYRLLERRLTDSGKPRGNGALEIMLRNEVAVRCRGDVKSSWHRQTGRGQPRKRLALPANFGKAQALVVKISNVASTH